MNLLSPSEDCIQLMLVLQSDVNPVNEKNNLLLPPKHILL